MKDKSHFPAVFFLVVLIVCDNEAIPPVPPMPNELVESLKTSVNYYNDTNVLLGKAELLQNYITKMKEYWDTILNDLKKIASTQMDMEKVFSTLQEEQEEMKQTGDDNPTLLTFKDENFERIFSAQLANRDKMEQYYVPEDFIGIETTSEEILALQSAMEGKPTEPMSVKLLEEFLSQMNKKTDSVVQKLVKMENQVKQIEKKVADYQVDFFVKKLEIATKVAELKGRKIFIEDRDEL